MKYRSFGKLDWKVSALGFGCMRLPTIKGDSSGEKVNEDEAIRMIRSAIDQGVNYIDTAYPYHNGTSEVVLGKALKDGYRRRVRVATKSPVWLVKKAEDFDTYLDEQLKRLQMDHVDFYLFHGLTGKSWRDVILKFDLLKKAEAAIGDGRIGHLGFSFHDEFDAFKEIVDGYDGWSFCQIQYNYMDTEYQAGTKGLKEAAAKGLAVVVMEPIKGGKLAVTPPPQVQSIWDEAKVKRKPAEWALRWVWNHPEVSVVLSGMSEMFYVEENLVYADRSGPNAMEPWELKLISRVKEAYGQLGFVGCTACRYCMPCPQGV